MGFFVVVIIFLLCSPRGDRVRSRVELISVLEGQDLSNFEYKTGKFYHGETPLPRIRSRKVSLGVILCILSMKTLKI